MGLFRSQPVLFVARKSIWPTFQSELTPPRPQKHKDVASAKETEEDILVALLPWTERGIYTYEDPLGLKDNVLWGTWMPSVSLP